MQRALRSAPVAVLAAAAALFLSSCAKKGLLTEEYPPSVYTGVERLEPTVHTEDPRFLVVGDTQSGWRLKERLFRTDRWLTKKAFIFPFYYLYNIGHGMAGAVSYLRQVPDYGGVERRLVRDALYEEVKRSRPDFLLHLGDICMNDGRRPRHWATYLNESKNDVPLLASVPVVPVIGNHEHANDERFGMPNYQTVFPNAPRFCVVEFPSLALFVIDSNVVLDQYHDVDDAEQERLWRDWILAPEGEGPAWLERELARHTQRFKVVAMHHPPVPMGSHFSDWTRSDYGPRTREKRREFLDLLMDHGVELVLSGHEHVYRHSTIRRGGGGPTGDAVLHAIVTSGGGAPVRQIMDTDGIEARRRSYLDEGLIVDLVKNEAVHHYSVIEVTAGALIVETFAVTSDDDRHAVLERVVIGGD